MIRDGAALRERGIDVDRKEAAEGGKNGTFLMVSNTQHRHMRSSVNVAMYSIQSKSVACLNGTKIVEIYLSYDDWLISIDLLLFAHLFCDSLPDVPRGVSAWPLEGPSSYVIYHGDVIALTTSRLQLEGLSVDRLERLEILRSHLDRKQWDRTVQEIAVIIFQRLQPRSKQHAKVV